MATKSARRVGAASEALKGLPEEPGDNLLKQMRSTQRRAKKRLPGRPTVDQSNELRDSLIHAAMHSFMARGFEGSSIEAIGRDAKVAKITIYRQFGSKEALFRAVANYALGTLRDRLASVSLSNESPERGLRKLISALHEAGTRPDHLAVLRLVIAEAVRFPEIAMAMMDEAHVGLEPVIDYLNGLRAEGHIVVDSTRQAALQLTALAVGGARPLLRDPLTDPMNKERWVESVYKTFARAWGLESVPGKTETIKPAEH